MLKVRGVATSVRKAGKASLKTSERTDGRRDLSDWRRSAHLSCSKQTCREYSARATCAPTPVEKIGWEAWTRTRIARSRVWSPTNWTTSQRGGTKRNRGTFPVIGTAAIRRF